MPNPGFQQDRVKTKAQLLREKEEEELQLTLALSLSSYEDEATRRKREEEKKQQQQSGQKAAALFQVRALYQFKAEDEGELSLMPGDIVDVYDCTTFADWWKGECKGNVGLFPQNYVEKLQGTTASTGNVGFKNELSNVENAIMQNMLPRLQELEVQLQNFDPQRDNLYSNERLLENYATIMKSRAQLMKLVEEYGEKRQQLTVVNDQFQEANSTYRKLVDASIMQYSRPQLPMPSQPQMALQQSQYVSQPPFTTVQGPVQYVPISQASQAQYSVQTSRPVYTAPGTMVSSSQIPQQQQYAQVPLQQQPNLPQQQQQQQQPVVSQPMMTYPQPPNTQQPYSAPPGAVVPQPQ